MATTVDRTWPVNVFADPEPAKASFSAPTAKAGPASALVGENHKWRLTVGVPGTGKTVELCSFTDFDFTVSIGHTSTSWNPGTPTPGAATFTVRPPKGSSAVTGTALSPTWSAAGTQSWTGWTGTPERWWSSAMQTGSYITVGAPLELSVSLDGGTTYLPVAVMTVTDKKRSFLNGVNSVQLQATGPLARLGRISIGNAAPSGAAYPIQLDGDRMLTYVKEAGAQYDPATWPHGSVNLIARKPETQIATSLMAEVVKSARGMLWETRSGRMLYESMNARSAARVPELTLDSCYIVAASEFGESWDDVINRITVSFGVETTVPDPANPGNTITNPKSEITREDAYSISVFGVLAETLDTDLAAGADADKIAQHIIDTYGKPQERINELQIVPLRSLPVAVAQKLLTMPPGLKAAITGKVPDDWDATVPWSGYVEGIKVTGSVVNNRREVSIVLTVSPEKK